MTNLLTTGLLAQANNGAQTLDHGEHAIFGEGVLIFFLILFGAVLVYTFRRRNQPMFDRAAHMPLENGVQEPRDAGSNAHQNEHAEVER